MAIADVFSNITDTITNVTTQFDGETPDSTMTELSPEQMKRRKTIRTVVLLVIGAIIIGLIIRMVTKK